ncbi:hypothetical protein MKX01_017891, partial [Papaver californicum]
YGSFGAYAQSKLANILHANELARRLKEDGVEITANSVHPGSIPTSLWHKSFNGWLGWVCKYVVVPMGNLMGKTVAQGASTTCYVALHPSNKGVTGEYFVDNNISKATSQANDPELAKKLWDFSMNLIS